MQAQEEAGRGLGRSALHRNRMGQGLRSARARTTADGKLNAITLPSRTNRAALGDTSRAPALSCPSPPSNVLGLQPRSKDALPSERHKRVRPIRYAAMA